MKLKNPNNIEFICPKCGCKENIPKSIVEFLDASDQCSDTHVPPRFDCKICNGKMLPKFFIGVNGTKYFYDDFKDKEI